MIIIINQKSKKSKCNSNNGDAIQFLSLQIEKIRNKNWKIQEEESEFHRIRFHFHLWSRFASIHTIIQPVKPDSPHAISIIIIDRLISISIEVKNYIKL